jgi:hypothetical protein
LRNILVKMRVSSSSSTIRMVLDLVSGLVCTYFRRILQHCRLFPPFYGGRWDFSMRN